MKLKKGDEVQVTKGKDKGKNGKIEKVLTKIEKVLVVGMNQYKKHVKARSQAKPSEIITITKPLHIGNVVFVCPKCHLQARIGYVLHGEKKTRICKKCKQSV